MFVIDVTGFIVAVLFNTLVPSDKIFGAFYISDKFFVVTLLTAVLPATLGFQQRSLVSTLSSPNQITRLTAHPETCNRAH